MGNNIIEVEHAQKEFRETTALQDVSVSFERGKIHGIVGRNGSGKTVLLKCICGLMSLSDGEIRVNDHVVKPAVAQNIGAIIEEPGFISNCSGFENLRLLASIRRKITKPQIRAAIEQVGLDPDSKKHVSKYSLGMRQRLGIAQAIMEDPELLILDEPMNGLDKQGVAEMRQLFSALRNDGKTILLASHSAEDIQILCDTVCEMDAGILTSVRGLD